MSDDKPDDKTCHIHGVMRLGLMHAGPDHQPTDWRCLLCEIARADKAEQTVKWQEESLRAEWLKSPERAEMVAAGRIRETARPSLATPKVDEVLAIENNYGAIRDGAGDAIDGVTPQEAHEHMVAALTRLARQQEGELIKLRADVKEWACAGCRTVYPGPPQAGFKCVMCPKCGGDTMPHATLKVREAESAARSPLATPSSETLSRAEDTLRARETENSVPGIQILTIDFWRARALYLAEQIVRSHTAPKSTYDVVADAVQEIADAAQEAFHSAGIWPGEWDGDNIVQDVKRGIVNGIELVALKSAPSSSVTPRTDEIAKRHWATITDYNRMVDHARILEEEAEQAKTLYRETLARAVRAETARSATAPKDAVFKWPQAFECRARESSGEFRSNGITATHYACHTCGAETGIDGKLVCKFGGAVDVRASESKP